MVNSEKCKFKRRYFTTKNDARNADLINKAEQITTALNNGSSVTVNPVPSPSVYSGFTKRCAYEIRIDNHKVAKFYLHVVNAETCNSGWSK